MTAAGGHGQGDPGGGHGQGDPAGGHGQGDPAGGHGQGDPAGGHGQGDPAGGNGQGNARARCRTDTPVARREYGAALGLLAAGSLLVLVAAGRPWVSVDMVNGLTTTAADASGRDLRHPSAAVGLVGLAGVVAVVASRGIGRVLVGALLVLAGLAGAALAPVLTPFADAWAAGRAGAVATSSPPGDLVTTGWAWVAFAGCLLVAVGGLLVVMRGRRWPSMGARYERIPAPTASAAATSDEPVDAGAERGDRSSAGTDARAVWDALDRGDDPTL